MARSFAGLGGALMVNGSRGPVLVVEDHPVNRLLLQQVLELEQIDVIAADSIAAAERALEAFVPPVIVLDLHLPDGYGLDFARKLKTDPSMSGCAIVACTAGPVANEEALARSVGCAEYVTKPIDTREFAKLVKSLISLPANH
jgi:CheY-like chemotaxis protein